MSQSRFPLVLLSEVLRQDINYITQLEPREYKKLSVKLYGRGVSLDTPTNGASVKMERHQLAKAGQVILSEIWGKKGAIGIVPEEGEGALVTSHFFLFGIDETKITREYLSWILRGNYLEPQLGGEARGTTGYAAVRPRNLLAATIPLPPLSEQRRIVVRIEELARKIEEARKLRSENAGYTKGFMEAAIQDVMSRYSNIGRFGDVITLKPRSGPSFPTQPDWTGTPVLMPSAVTGFGVHVTKVEFGLGDERVSDKDRLVPRDLLIARGNKKDQVGNAGVVPHEAKGWVCANLLMRLQVDYNRADPYFCIYWLRSPKMRSHVKQSMTGTNPNIQKVNQRIILDYPFPTDTSLSEQRRTVSYLDSLQTKVDTLKRLQAETAAELDAMVPAVLDRAFKGGL